MFMSKNIPRFLTNLQQNRQFSLLGIGIGKVNIAGWRTPRSWINVHQRVGLVRPLLTSPVLKTEIEPEMVDVTFIRSDGTKITTKGKIGDNLLDVVVNNDVDLDGFGACEGTLACSTCHLIFKQKDFNNIKEKITDEEMDMLDMAYGLCDTSRLGCQVCLTKELAGVEVKVPDGFNDARS